MENEIWLFKEWRLLRFSCAGKIWHVENVSANIIYILYTDRSNAISSLVFHRPNASFYWFNEWKMTSFDLSTHTSKQIVWVYVYEIKVEWPNFNHRIYANNTYNGKVTPVYVSITYGFISFSRFIFLSSAFCRWANFIYRFLLQINTRYICMYVWYCMWLKVILYTGE